MAAGRPRAKTRGEIPELISKEDFGRIVGIPVSSVRKYQREGLIPPGPEEGLLYLEQAFREFFQHFMSEARRSRRVTKPVNAVYKARAEKLAIDIAIKKGDLFHRDVFNAAIATVVGPLKSEIMSIGSRSTRDMAIRKVIDDECEALLLRLTGNVEEAEASLERNIAAFEAESEDDSGSMGEEE